MLLRRRSNGVQIKHVDRNNASFELLLSLRVEYRRPRSSLLNRKRQSHNSRATQNAEYNIYIYFERIELISVMRGVMWSGYTIWEDRLRGVGGTVGGNEIKFS